MYRGGIFTFSSVKHKVYQNGTSWDLLESSAQFNSSFGRAHIRVLLFGTLLALYLTAKLEFAVATCCYSALFTFHLVPALFAQPTTTFPLLHGHILPLAHRTIPSKCPIESDCYISSHTVIWRFLQVHQLPLWNSRKTLVHWAIAFDLDRFAISFLQVVTNFAEFVDSHPACLQGARSTNSMTFADSNHSLFDCLKQLNDEDVYKC